MKVEDGASRFIIGVDPDVDASGVALYFEDKSFQLGTMSFPLLLDFLQLYKERICEVFVEAGYLVSAHWHTKVGHSMAKNASIANDSGRNGEVGRKIVEMLAHYKIKRYEVKPFKKTWGKDNKSKISHAELVKKARVKLPGRTNQEERDATLIVLQFGETYRWPRKLNFKINDIS